MAPYHLQQGMKAPRESPPLPPFALLLTVLLCYVFFFGGGASPDTSGVSLLPIGLQAFLNYNPIRATTDPTEPVDFYRSVRCVSYTWKNYI